MRLQGYEDGKEWSMKDFGVEYWCFGGGCGVVTNIWKDVNYSVKTYILLQTNIT